MKGLLKFDLINPCKQQTWRDKIIIISALMQQFLLFLLLGFVFFRIKDDQAGVQNRYGVLFFICINQVR